MFYPFRGESWLGLDSVISFLFQENWRQTMYAFFVYQYLACKIIEICDVLCYHFISNIIIGHPEKISDDCCYINCSMIALYSVSRCAITVSNVAIVIVHYVTPYLVRVPMCYSFLISTWWHHQMEIFSAFLALCAGNSPVTGGCGLLIRSTEPAECWQPAPG